MWVPLLQLFQQREPSTSVGVRAGGFRIEYIGFLEAQHELLLACEEHLSEQLELANALQERNAVQLLLQLSLPLVIEHVRAEIIRGPCTYLDTFAGSTTEDVVQYIFETIAKNPAVEEQLLDRERKRVTQHVFARDEALEPLNSHAADAAEVLRLWKVFVRNEVWATRTSRRLKSFVSRCYLSSILRIITCKFVLIV